VLGEVLEAGQRPRALLDFVEDQQVGLAIDRRVQKQRKVLQDPVRVQVPGERGDEPLLFLEVDVVVSGEAGLTELLERVGFADLSSPLQQKGPAPGGGSPGIQLFADGSLHGVV
jgi:hypothetical protein